MPRTYDTMSNEGAVHVSASSVREKSRDETIDCEIHARPETAV